MRKLSSNFRSCSRRRALQVGSAGVLGLSLPQWLAVQAHAANSKGKPAAKNVLVILEQGGLSHIDTWDQNCPANDSAGRLKMLFVNGLR